MTKKKSKNFQKMLKKNAKNVARRGIMVCRTPLPEKKKSGQFSDSPVWFLILLICSKPESEFSRITICTRILEFYGGRGFLEVSTFFFRGLRKKSGQPTNFSRFFQKNDRWQFWRIFSESRRIEESCGETKKHCAWPIDLKILKSNFSFRIIKNRRIAAPKNYLFCFR